MIFWCLYDIKLALIKASIHSNCLVGLHFHLFRPDRNYVYLWRPKLVNLFWRNFISMSVKLLFCMFPLWFFCETSLYCLLVTCLTKWYTGLGISIDIELIYIIYSPIRCRGLTAVLQTGTICMYIFLKNKTMPSPEGG